MDVKKLTKDGNSVGPGYSIDACLRTCEIIEEMNAEEYCGFLIPTGDPDGDPNWSPGSNNITYNRYVGSGNDRFIQVFLLRRAE